MVQPFNEDEVVEYEYEFYNAEDVVENGDEANIRKFVSQKQYAPEEIYQKVLELGFDCFALIEKREVRRDYSSESFE